MLASMMFCSVRYAWAGGKDCDRLVVKKGGRGRGNYVECRLGLKSLPTTLGGFTLQSS